MTNDVISPLGVGRRWIKSKPLTAGIYENRCIETGGNASRVTVFDKNRELWVDDPDVGHYPLTHYHDQLTDLEWRRVA